MAGIGHNGGPTMERGQAWRSYQWRQAQKAAMPSTIPLMVVKMRVRRAAELGMDYRSYARIRQAAGQDILALLFSSNALGIIGDGARMPAPEAARLATVQGAERLALVHRPHAPEAVEIHNPELDAARAAPTLRDSWSAMRTRLEDFIQTRRLSGHRVVIVGDTALETEWATAARAAGYLPAADYFARRVG